MPKIIFLAAICLLIVAPLWASPALESSLIQWVLEEYDLDADYVEISIRRTTLDRTVDLTGCEIVINPMVTSPPCGTFPLKVEIYRDGEAIQKGSVTLQVRLYADLLVPVRNIRRYEILEADMFETKRFEITHLNEKMLEDFESAAGCRARSNFSTGQRISLNRIEVIPDVYSGHEVVVLGRSDLFEIRTRGVALQNGEIGETIRVRTMDSNKILRGRITGSETVEVSL